MKIFISIINSQLLLLVRITKMLYLKLLYAWYEDLSRAHTQVFWNWIINDHQENRYKLEKNFENYPQNILCISIA